MQRSRWERRGFCIEIANNNLSIERAVFGVVLREESPKQIQDSLGPPCNISLHFFTSSLFFSILFPLPNLSLQAF